MKFIFVALIMLTTIIFSFAPRSESQQRPKAGNDRAHAASLPDRRQPANSEKEQLPITRTEPAKSQPQHWYGSPEWLLVIVGLITCFFIGWQSLATAQAARATQVSTEVLWASQRSQIAAKAHGLPTKDLMSDAPRVQLELINKGMTPAYDVTYESWIELIPTASGNFTANAAYFKSLEKIALYPNHIPLILNIPLGRTLTGIEREGLIHMRLYACVRVRAEYRDGRGLGRFANFGFYVLSNGLGFLPKYNDAN